MECFPYNPLYSLTGTGFDIIAAVRLLRPQFLPGEFIFDEEFIINGRINWRLIPDNIPQNLCSTLRNSDMRYSYNTAKEL